MEINAVILIHCGTFIPAKPSSIHWMIKFHFNLPEKYESIKLSQIKLFYGGFVP